MNLITFSRLGKMGRLGNCLFQIASTIGIGHRNNLTPCFPDWNYSSYFETPLLSLELLHRKRADINGYKIVSEPSFKYSSISLDNERFNYDLVGYFQSEKYFSHCENEVRNKLTLMSSLKKVVDTRYKYVYSSKDSMISIHVRRGDYLGLEEYHTNLASKTSYYLNAMDTLRRKYLNSKDIACLLFSDDLEFSSQWFKESFPDLYFVPIQETSEISSLYLMSQCKYHITANSSFSWWGSWLSEVPGKIVLMPYEWFGPKGPKEHDLYYKDCMVIK